MRRGAAWKRWGWFKGARLQGVVQGCKELLKGARLQGVVEGCKGEDRLTFEYVRREAVNWGHLGG